MFEYRVLVPLAYNDGQPVPLATMETVEASALAQFGGFSVQGGWRGAWIDKDGHVYEDGARALYLATDDPAKLHRFASWLAAVLDQQAIYVTQVGAVQFVAAPQPIS